MKTVVKIAIGVGVAAAVAAAVVWYKRRTRQPYLPTGNQQPETVFSPTGNQQPAIPSTALPVQIPGSPILTTTYTPEPVVKFPSYSPFYSEEPGTAMKQAYQRDTELMGVASLLR